MNKKYLYRLVAIFLVLAGIIAFAPNFVAAQEPTVTLTLTATFTDTATTTSTTTPSSTPTFTPTIAPTETPAPTVVPTEAQTSLPTLISVEEIHTGFVDDFTAINEKLDNIYDKVDTPPGWFLVENILSDYIYGMLNSSASTSGTWYWLFKLLGIISVSLKLVITVVRVTGKDKDKGKIWDMFATSLIFIYALIFVLILFFPPNTKSIIPSASIGQPPLSQLDQKLDKIIAILNDNNNSPLSPDTVPGNVSELTVFQNQLITISNQLDDMKLQDQQAIDGINQKIDELNTKIQDAKSISAKRGLQIFNTLLLLLILGLLIYPRFENRR